MIVLHKEAVQTAGAFQVVLVTFERQCRIKRPDGDDRYNKAMLICQKCAAVRYMLPKFASCVQAAAALCLAFVC